MYNHMYNFNIFNPIGQNALGQIALGQNALG
jgi:hypothetical protein